MSSESLSDGERPQITSSSAGELSCSLSLGDYKPIHIPCGRPQSNCTSLSAPQTQGIIMKLFFFYQLYDSYLRAIETFNPNSVCHSRQFYSLCAGQPVLQKLKQNKVFAVLFRTGLFNIWSDKLNVQWFTLSPCARVMNQLIKYSISN